AVVFLVATALVVGSTCYTLREHLAWLPAYTYLALVGIVLAAVDARVHRLPDVVVLPSYPVLAALFGVAALVDDHVPRPGVPAGAPPRSPLTDLVEALTGRCGLPRSDVAVQWFERYLDVLVEPALGLYLGRGVGVEAHHQNTLVTLDADGWPVAGWYRDSQGYYLAVSRAAQVRALVPGFGDGVAAVFDDALVEQRIVYYLVVNNVFGLVGALGAS
nr:IucA/IucC family C-terminal-domain containing protein [Micromonospora sp. DSM 115978]